MADFVTSDEVDAFASAIEDAFDDSAALAEIRKAVEARVPDDTEGRLVLLLDRIDGYADENAIEATGGA